MFITLTDSNDNKILVNLNRIDYIRNEDNEHREDLNSLIVFDKDTWITVKESIAEIHGKLMYS